VTLPASDPADRLPPARVQRRWQDLAARALLLGALAAGLWWFAHLSYTVCPFANLTGLPCPGCGLTRATLHLLRADFAGAVRLHPLSPLIAPGVIIFLVWGSWTFLRGSSFPATALPTARHRPRRRFELLWWLLAVTLIGTWGARFLGYFGGPVPIERPLIQLAP
jgi:hypothetical protein